MKKAIDTLKAAASILNGAIQDEDDPLATGLELLNDALVELQALPRWETLEQREQRTGKAWKGAVYFNVLNNDTNESVYANGEYQVSSTRDIIETIRNVPSYTGVFNFRVVIICATEAGQPPDDWRPEEGQ